MARKFSVAYFVHSLRSDWNNGNAHFLRGLLNNLVEMGHNVTIYEPADGWSIENLKQEEQGMSSLEQFKSTYPDLKVVTYGSTEVCDEDSWSQHLENTEIVVFHEWNPPELARTLLRSRATLKFRLIFHDTHHRVSSSPEQIRLFDIPRFDGVLAFGETLRQLYREQFSIESVWTLHEAADISVFRPIPHLQKKDDVVWIGNWGDNERSSEIAQYFLEPASEMHDHRFSIYGVRYPENGLASLRKAGVHYCGYLPNLQAPPVYAAARITVHIPRQQYAAAMNGIPTIRVFEALACGIPLISAPWTDSEELFRPGDFLPVKNAGEARRAMEYLLSDASAAQAQALRGLQTILTHHTCRHRAEQLSRIMENFLS